MSWLTNTTDADLEVPALGLTVPAGQAVEFDGEAFDHPLFTFTKTKPKAAREADTTEES